MEEEARGLSTPLAVDVMASQRARGYSSRSSHARPLVGVRGAGWLTRSTLPPPSPACGDARSCRVGDLSTRLRPSAVSMWQAPMARRQRERWCRAQPCRSAGRHTGVGCGRRFRSGKAAPGAGQRIASRLRSIAVGPWYSMHAMPSAATLAAERCRQPCLPVHGSCLACSSRVYAPICSRIRSVA